MSWRDQAPAGRSGGVAREGSPRKLAEDYQIARMAEQSIEDRRRGVNNREWREAHARSVQLADELAAMLSDIRAAGAKDDGIKGRSNVAHPTRPPGSTLRTGRVASVSVDTEALWDQQGVVGHSAVWELAKKIFDAKMDLLSEAVKNGAAIIQDPKVRLKLHVEANAVPNHMYSDRAPDGRGSYLPSGHDQIAWYELPGDRAEVRFY